MNRFDPELLAKVEPWRLHVLEQGVIPLKQKELMMVAMCAVARFLPGLRIHAERALEQGATAQELFETCALSQLIGGVPSYRESVLIVEELVQTPTGGPQRSE
ncbi:MAG: carboxymuconolactone decarboxylase family protein [Candidatus Dormibacteraeota bacterium]|uniref:Carboxymuconolactone decarboxylase family protein n=1 Tax=Candidatus Aeolococcus gillhamiae TaxID=3127015 RepID=A0A934JVA0_9BACT|nr:carboxymuconolactone decarboxylase family protein [Candidatus Dormibacteraeota bacterium]